MKNAIIIHGTKDTPDLYWFPYLKKNLEELGYEVWAPQMPNSEVPNVKDWLPFVLSNGKFSEETILIGHSAGAQLVLSILENITPQIKKALLVSGYSEPLRNNDETKDHGKFDYEKIKKHAAELIFVNSDDDPWGCDDKQGKIMFDNLGGMLIIRHDGHMGSTMFNQPYKEFPLLLKLLI